MARATTPSDKGVGGAPRLQAKQAGQQYAAVCASANLKSPGLCSMLLAFADDVFLLPRETMLHLGIYV
jgi:hypothetical protein